jgi:hypothetical protein
MNFTSQQYSEDEIRSYVLNNNISTDEWEDISWNQVLSEDFIREFSEHVDWYWISYLQDLSDDFIREFRKEVHWRSILHKRVLSKKFKYIMHENLHIFEIKNSDNPKEVL